MENNFLEVTKVTTEVAQSTNRDYMRAIFAPVKFIGDRTVKTSRDSAAVLFNVGKEPQVGDLYEGAIHKFTTTDYEIDGRTVNTISVVAMSGENPTDVANAQLARNNACVVLNGKPTVDLEELKKKNAQVAG